MRTRAVGFDNERYLDEQSRAIVERVDAFAVHHPRRYLLKKSIVRDQASFAAFSS